MWAKESTDGERQPLQSTKNGHSLENVETRAKVSKPSLAIGGLVVIAAAAYFGFRFSDMSESIKKNPNVEPSTAPGNDELMYRPFCVHYGKDDSKYRILQTSIQNPSQQWSSIPCFQESKKSKKSTLMADSFGAPDASFLVNFSQLAFPQRETPILGFGGAFTEAASLNFHSLDKEGQEAVLELLFGSSGLGYSKGRVHINSCDFSIQSYSFDDVEDDFDLEYFDTAVKHDVESGMVDFILRATSKFREAWASDDGMDGSLRLYASPWSPPAWMKSPTWEDEEGAEHSSFMTGSAQPTCIRNGTGVDSPYAKAWALYFSKFFTAYENLGLPFFGVTPQNEPEFPAPWEACSHTPVTEADFVGYHLGPQLEKDHPNIKILGFDHNKDHIVTWVDALQDATSPSKKYISGTAYHWYAGGNNRILDGALGSPNMHRLQAEFDKLDVDPKHFILGIESCHCPYTGYGGGSIDVYWARAERYAHTILADLAAGSNGWMEWNFILDSQGGPNHLGNLCDSSLLAVPHRAKNAPADFPHLMEWEKTNASKKFGVNIGDGRTLPELNALGFPAKYLEKGVAVQPMYFYMGHISRYVRPGSRAVMGLVDQATSEDGSLTFRPKGQSVPGGGVNDLAQPDVEITAWPCEGSTRQSFNWDAQSGQIQVFGHDWLGAPTTSCISNKIHKDLKGLVLVPCTMKRAASFEIVKYENYTNFVLASNADRSTCLAIEDLMNGGGAYGPRGGAPLVLGSCSSDTAKFDYNEITTEISSAFEEGEYVYGKVCLTTGWPFLQMGAFDTPNGEAKKTVVILNEARDAANYALADDGKLLVTGSIPPRSIQTLLVD